VIADQIDDRVTYALNHKHVLYPVVESLLAARQELTNRMRRTLATWDPEPAFAALYGSAARRDGDEDSDVDLLLVHPSLSPSARSRWAKQVHELRQSVNAWSGNRLQVLDLSSFQFRRLVRREAGLVDEWRRDLVLLAGTEPDELQANR
jgi:predicted nucleotidyltransferase